MHIQICGPDGSGKSTLARKLAGPLQCEIYAFATALREHCIATGLLSREQAYAKPTPPEVRALLRAESKRVKATHGETIWVQRTREALAGKSRLICDDMRYLHEIADDAIIIYLNGEIPPELANEPSFAELPAISERAFIKLPAKPADEEVTKLINWLIEATGN